MKRRPGIWMTGWCVWALLMTACGSDTEVYRELAEREKRREDSIQNQMVVAEGKAPLRLLTDRPYNLETPLRYFLQDLTPNDVFFVRWHLPLPPTAADTDTFRLRIRNSAGQVLAAYSLQDLQTKFAPYKVVAVCVCSGNARNCQNPKVPGAQWVNGGMGNAEWTGVRLKDLLYAVHAGGTKFVSFNGLDNPVLPTTPDFEKSLAYAHAADGEVMVAYAMNGQPLPLLNGFPLKLVVPGWYATYWVGMLSDITLHRDSFKGYWMDKAYRVPRNLADANEQPGKLSTDTEPISRLNVRSLFVWPEPGDTLKTGHPSEIQGLAMDDGTGITKVEISSDGGKTWQPARPDKSLGKYSWLRWRYSYTPLSAGRDTLMVKATNAAGHTQPMQHWNRGGYMRNEVESLPIYIRE